MKKMMTGVAAITMMFATACSNEEIVKVDDSQEVFTVTATKGIDSRLEMKDGSLVWSDGDKLYVFGEGVDGFLTLISGAGTKTGTFVGRISGSATNLTNAVFGDDVKVEGGKVKISLENQSTEECDAPMDGRFSADKGSISLTPLCGIEKMKLNVTPTNGQMTIKGSGVAGMEFVDGEWRTLMGENLITIAGVEANESFYIPFFTQDEETPLTVTVNGASYTYISTIQEKQQRGTDLELNLDNNELKDESGNTIITTVSSLDALKEALENGHEQIALNADITNSAIITISSDVVLYGNGHTITYTGNERAITVENSANGANLTLKDLNIQCSGNSCERGINYNTTGTLILENVNVSGKKVTYALNLPSSSDGAEVSITNSTLEGHIALNIWGEDVKVNVQDSKLYGVDDSANEGYSVIKLNNDGTNSAEGTIVKVIDGHLEVKYSGNGHDEKSFAIDNGTHTGKIELIGTTSAKDGIFEPVAVAKFSNGTSYNCASLEEAVELAKEVYIIRDIKLNKNISVENDMTIFVNSNIIIDLNGYGLSGTIENNGTLTILNNASEASVNLNNELTIEIGENAAELNLKNVDGIRVDNTNGGTVNKGTNGSFIIYHKIINGDFNDFINLKYQENKINTIIIEGTFTVDNKDLAQVENFNPSNYFDTELEGSFGNMVRRIELANDAILDVSDNNDEVNGLVTSIGFEDIFVHGNAEIYSNNATSNVYFHRNAEITLADNASLTLERVHIKRGNDPTDSADNPNIKCVEGGNAELIKSNGATIEGTFNISESVDVTENN